LVLLDVPFLAQPEDLCGGAAAAMVLRYWGDTGAQAEDFAGLVTRGVGITTGALTSALEVHGLRALPFRASAGEVRDHVAKGRPVIGLIGARGGRLHYVVIVGWGEGRVVLHDPADQAFRVRKEEDVVSAWHAGGDWALLAFPKSEHPSSGVTEAFPEGAPAVGECGGLVDQAVDLAQRDRLGAADERLLAARAICPQEARPLRELASLRFKQERYRESAELADAALRVDAADDFTWRLLGTSRFLAQDAAGALRAWNRVDEPRLDILHVDGLERTPEPVVKDRLRLAPRALLTPDAVGQARRRLSDLPGFTASRLSLEPLGAGRADVRAAVVERPLLDPFAVWLARVPVDALAFHEANVYVAGAARTGEVVDAGGRWWNGRPAAWLNVSQPQALGLPGLVRLSALWDEQSYATGESASGTAREERVSAALSAADWYSSSGRLTARVGVDEFRGGDTTRSRGTFGTLGLECERRLAGDRGAALAHAAIWLGTGPTFGTMGVAVAARNGPEPRRFVAGGTAGLDVAGSHAPFALWPGAGTGAGRPELLRGHPLVSDDGLLDGAAFGRVLWHASIEVEARVVRLGPIGVGVAAFLDTARATERLNTTEPGAFADAGLGARLHLGRGAGSIRFDVAAPLGESKWRYSTGWVPAWPTGRR
jgi:hypothetical protein